MKYRHEFHAGNFADVHKHVTLLALLDALQRKSAGFLLLDTHAGRGDYRLTQPSNAAAASGLGNAGHGPASTAAAAVMAAWEEAGETEPELERYAQAVRSFRKETNEPQAYPGSPALALSAMRPQDRAVFIEIEPGAARSLRHLAENPALASRPRVECADGFERLRAFLPPPERRGIVLLDPPYEETARDFRRVIDAIVEALQRFRTGVIAAWYPLKERHSIDAWLHACAAAIAEAAAVETLVSELWLYPPDSRVSLNGSGLLIVNPPYLVADRMRAWLPQLLDILKPGGGSGTSIRPLGAAAGA